MRNIICALAMLLTNISCIECCQAMSPENEARGVCRRTGLHVLPPSKLCNSLPVKFEEDDLFGARSEEGCVFDFEERISQVKEQSEADLMEINERYVNGKLSVSELIYGLDCEDGIYGEDGLPKKKRKKIGLWQAANSGRLDEVKELIEKELCKRNREFRWSEINKFNPESGDFPVIAAAKRGHVEVVTYLAANGASLISSDVEGETALDYLLEHQENVSDDKISFLMGIAKEQTRILRLCKARVKADCPRGNKEWWEDRAYGVFLLNLSDPTFDPQPSRIRAEEVL